MRTLKGCQTISVTPSGSETIDFRSRGVRATRSTPGYYLSALGLTQIYKHTLDGKVRL